MSEENKRVGQSWWGIVSCIMGLVGLTFRSISEHYGGIE